MAGDPAAHGRMFVGGMIVENGVDGLAGENLALDGIEEADSIPWGDAHLSARRPCLRW